MQTPSAQSQHLREASLEQSQSQSLPPLSPAQAEGSLGTQTLQAAVSFDSQQWTQLHPTAKRDANGGTLFN